MHLATSQRRHDKRKKATIPLLRTSTQKRGGRKNIGIFLFCSIKSRTFAPAKSDNGSLKASNRQKEHEDEESTCHKEDLLAQLVEHNTFNVGVMGSSPIQVT